MKRKNKIKAFVGLVLGLIILSSLALAKHGAWMGHDFRERHEAQQAVNNDTLQTLADGSMVVNTSGLGADITGYAGKVPLKITIANGVVTHIEALPNDETPDFFNHAASLFNQWKGKTVDEAAGMKVDAVSGATFSSRAIIGNMQRGLTYAKQAQAEPKAPTFDTSAKNLAGIVVVLMAAILPLFIKNRTYRICQMALNVVVLGFWCGTFLSYASLMGYAAHGMDVASMVIPIIMLITAFIYPLLGKKSYYCTNVCPFGSLQQVAATCVKHKMKIKPSVLRALNRFRQVLWVALMLLIWGGVWSEWVDYEPFSAFIFQSASWVVVVIAATFVLLSTVVTRPYCRFDCPMGTLLKISQGGK